MFPHQSLDWNLRRLETQLESTPADLSLRLEFASSCLSRAWFHDGGETWFNRALTHARRTLQIDANSVEAAVVAGIALVHLKRLDHAVRHLQESLRLAPDRADVHAGLGLLHEARGDRREAIREYEIACRMQPDSWEPHFLLSRALTESSEQAGSTQRILERSQFHGVKALSLQPAASTVSQLLNGLGLSCLRNGRFNDAHKVFQRLLEVDKQSPTARHHLGVCLFHQGKFKNAVLFLRQYLDVHPDSPDVLELLGRSYLKLGEVERAREVCHKTLTIEPGHIAARWTLACAMLEENQIDEAIKLLREILRDAPDHLSAFATIVKLRTTVGDVKWLGAALRAEVSVFHRLPLHDLRESTTSLQGGGPSGPGALRDRRRAPPVRITPRATTRERIAILLRAHSALEADEVPLILDGMNLTTDEGLRFQLWEAALDAVALRKARAALPCLDAPGANYSAAYGREILSIASSLPESKLFQGLQFGEDDLNRAAIARHGPAKDVQAHRMNVDRERQEARAWQALLLLAIATGSSAAGKHLLLRWAADADSELADAARAALVMVGDTVAADRLREKARTRGAEHLLASLLAEVKPADARFHPRTITEGEDAHCSTCGRRAPDVEHLMAGEKAIVCNTCMTTIARDRRELATDDPSISCALCGRTGLDTRNVYIFRGTPVCAHCVDHSLGLLEREAVDRYLASW